MDTPLLWHIPLSHYSEKVRWALDYKGIAHRRRVLGPDYLVQVWLTTGQGKLPVLWLGGRRSPIPRASSPRLRGITPSRRFIPVTWPRGSARLCWRTISTRR